LHWIRNRLFARPSGADIELHERHSASAVNVPYAKGKRVRSFQCKTLNTVFSLELHRASRRETLQQERNGESSKFLLQAAYPLPIALSHSNPVAQLKPSHLHNPMLQSPHPPHLPLLFIQLRALILMQQLITLVAGLVSGFSSVALLLSIPMVIIDLYDDISFHDLI
jgi:hypothetical protein